MNANIKHQSLQAFMFCRRDLWLQVVFDPVWRTGSGFARLGARQTSKRAP